MQRAFPKELFVSAQACWGGIFDNANAFEPSLFLAVAPHPYIYTQSQQKLIGSPSWMLTDSLFWSVMGSLCGVR